MSIRAACSIARVVAGIGWASLGAALLGLAPAAGALATEASTADDYPIAREIRLGGDEMQTRLVIDFSQKIESRIFTLANPYRVVIDLPQVAFRFPPATGESGRGLIKAFRFGLMMTGGSRLVVDLTRPARVEKSYMLEAGNDQPARFVLDLGAIDRESFLRNIAIQNRVREAPPVVKAPPTGDQRPLIVLDPGHGGLDNGTKAASGEMEKDIVLGFAVRLRDKIEQGGKYRVVMTRTDDTFVALPDRVAFARVQQAALLISIHADALPKGEGDAQGASVYTLSETASDAEAARLAEAENRTDVIAGVDLTTEANDVADILIDLAQRETKIFSVQFARGLIDSMKTATRMHKNSLKSAGFRVLKAPDVPSVLVELGYVSNKQDLKSLISTDWRDHTADSMAQAIDRFFSTRLAGGARANGQN